MRRLLLLVCAALLALPLTSCKDQAEEDADRAATTTETARAEPMEPDEPEGGEMNAEEGGEDLGNETAEQMPEGAQGLEVAQKDPIGEFLVDAEGMSLYMFEADTKGEASTCYDACAEAWPPLTVEQPNMMLGPGVDESLVGVVERRDGTMQLAYAGWPLYYYATDQEPGDTLGQDKTGFGAQWYLMSPQGNVIRDEGQAVK